MQIGRPAPARDHAAARAGRTRADGFPARLWRLVVAGLLWGAAIAAHAAGAPKMALLLPDSAGLDQPQVAAWIDAVQEQGYEAVVYRNAQFLSDGSSAVLKYRGLVVPDGVQQVMGDDLVTAIKAYVQQGGQLMLVYDAGALDARGAYAVPRSRFSDLVGVDYVLYDALRDRTVGLGPATAAMAVMRALHVPPGKSSPYVPPADATAAAPAGALAATASGAASLSGAASVLRVKPGKKVSFLPVGRGNPAGLAGYNHGIYGEFKLRENPGDKVRAANNAALDQRTVQTDLTARHPKAITAAAVEQATASVLVPETSRPSAPATPDSADAVSALDAATAAATGVDPDDAYLATYETTAPDATHAVVNYGYDVLSYPSFVTQGAFGGQTLMSSPFHGLMAGVNGYGLGKVLFVNLPLSYLKGQTDGMLMHGFIDWFARRQLKLPKLTSVPNGMPGLIFNWHLDSKAAQAPTQTLVAAGIFRDNKPFSIHMTAGPDTITFGDNRGWNLPGNPTAKSLLVGFDQGGHQVGSHGGWIHDYYGLYASESNQSTFQQYLVLNDNAVVAAIGHAATEYSAPEGNNPTWAVDWLESRGVVAYYFLGHSGMAPTRGWRNGVLNNPSMWAMPLLTNGTTATFEEWQEQNVPKAEIRAWYKAVIGFVLNRQTVRELYAHPPGAADWQDVLKYLMTQVANRGSQMKWYSMTDAARWMGNRRNVAWSVSTASSGAVQVDASHPSSLAGFTWVFKKADYAKPVVAGGSANATVVNAGIDWRVTAKAVRSVRFSAVAQ